MGWIVADIIADVLIGYFIADDVFVIITLP